MPACHKNPLRLAVLMTCFNRREQTLLCLEAVWPQLRQDDLHATVVLVDDGSTDGTAAAVQARFPEVQVLRGSGQMFWSRGMRLAFAHAAEQSFDFYLWLNDDTILFPNALRRLLATHKALQQQAISAIITGSTCDRSSGARSYGGFLWSRGGRRSLVPVNPSSETAVPCDTMNGNCTLIAREVAEVVGNLDPTFHHSFGDFDYGFRARAAGFPIFVAPGFFGMCSDNPQKGTWRDREAGFRRRWRHLNSPKGSPFPEWKLYCRRHLGVLWPMYALSPYVKTLASAFVPRAMPGRMR